MSLSLFLNLSESYSSSINHTVRINGWESIYDLLSQPVSENERLFKVRPLYRQPDTQ